MFMRLFQSTRTVVELSCLGFFALAGFVHQHGHYSGVFRDSSEIVGLCFGVELLVEVFADLLAQWRAHPRVHPEPELCKTLGPLALFMGVAFSNSVALVSSVAYVDAFLHNA
jgi:hypothetical protein